MNRIDRLFATLLLLQNRTLVRAEDLAEHFETSKRTIYRDIAALSEMGVPIVSLPGEGYSLMEGYFLPPLLFTSEEAAALFLAAELLHAQATGSIVEHPQRALVKLENILPTKTRMAVEQMREIIQFYASQRRFDLDDRKVLDIQRAITARRVIRIHYTSYPAGSETLREIEPAQLTYGDGAWYVGAYWRLRQDRRTFRLSRIERYQLLRETFAPRAVMFVDAPIIAVKVRFAPEVIRWVRERQHYGYAGEVDNIMIYHVQDLREIRSWLFGWATNAEVLEPESLRAELRTEAKRLWEMLT